MNEYIVHHGERSFSDSSSWETCEDKTLYWTLSLYIDPDQLPAALREKLHPTNKLRVQASYLGSIDLRDTIEPLFNDIADRERLSQVDDFLLDVPGPRQGEPVIITVPETITWSTEGTTFQAQFREPISRTLRCRRFWYVHLNGALSYHISFAFRYQHTPADFYFISMLQKVVAPKEFTLDAPPTGEFLTATERHLKLFPLEKMTARSPSSGPAPLKFWDFIRVTFDQHADHLFRHMRVSLHAPRGDERFVDKLKRQVEALLPAAPRKHSYFDQLIANDPFIEVPRLAMPRARFLFLFQDRTFFQDLLPKTADGAPRPRRELVTDADYDCFKEWIQERISEAKLASALNKTKPVVVISHEFLDYLAAETPDRLRYLFLAGFNQNIIDFINQEASEILDSTDPIYPRTSEQEEESFFVRYANPRALIQFVRASRSLETGNDFIGTCPYAFLVHTIALHNEFLVRQYEQQVEELTRDIGGLNAKRQLSHAARRFYNFRTQTYTQYRKFRYANIFRYDTEADVFKEVERRRGSLRKDQYLEQIVINLEAQTRDLEGRIRSNEDRQLTTLVAGVGAFSILQVVLQILDYFEKHIDDPQTSKVFFGINFGNIANINYIASLLIQFTGFVLVMLAALVVFFYIVKPLGVRIIRLFTRTR